VKLDKSRFIELLRKGDLTKIFTAESLRLHWFEKSNIKAKKALNIANKKTFTEIEEIYTKKLKK
jgi:hypothetical protein